ncbi:hypothetical protein [Actinacidiphila bryophytorum]|uniref:hypothetical protein n=1 Tax=Actinacidiphila bryophytorum TaxID=1436133 RepID=UPI001961C493|nr:hypothetical protein [Actinacidiphila bryophytorum]MBM9439939.1 hypothetical protein [Actinacidiphila bryophytorum]MBN6544768.1 hypothetical protein [Actinacidiphila bryophytorum]
MALAAAGQRAGDAWKARFAWSSTLILFGFRAVTPETGLTSCTGGGPACAGADRAGLALANEVVSASAATVPTHRRRTLIRWKPRPNHATRAMDYTGPISQTACEQA